MYQLNDSTFNSVVTPDVMKLRDIFKKYGYEIRITGGAVRDVLMSKQPKDIDFATSASVLQMKKLLATENINTVNLYGEKYGTVTACITGRAFEITTINLSVPGRPTKEDWIRDAETRDLTINSMFLDFDSNIHDHLGGYDDLKKGKIHFIGNIDQAIEGRHYRILRYFRFHSLFSKDPRHHDDGVLQAIKSNAAGLQRISGERIWKELKIILQQKSRNVVIKTMMDVGIGPYIGLPSPNVAVFQKVSRINKDTDIEPASLLAALANDLRDVNHIQTRFKYSTYEKKLIIYIIKNRGITSDDSLLPYLKLIYCETKLSRNIAKQCVTELLLYKGAEELLDELQEISSFPINIRNLKINGLPEDKLKCKFVMEQLIEYWYEKDYDVSRKELREMIPNILQEYRRI